MQKKELLDFLSGYLTEKRRYRFEEVIRNRTRHLAVALENIYQPQNASAVLRSCDCFGIQDVHIIENNNKYNINPDVELGSSKWLNLHRYNKKGNNTREALESLKKKGYRLVATTPHAKECTPEELDISRKTALLFGTELTGLSDTAMEMADSYVTIPMYGFTESFNISVSAALMLHTLGNKMRRSVNNWELTDEEKTEILLEWCENTVKNADLLEKEYIKRKKEAE